MIYLSTSCFKKKPIDDAIRACGDLSNKAVELSAPHPFQSLDEIEQILIKYKKAGYSMTLHNYFPPPEKSFVLNMAAKDDETRNSSKGLIYNALNLCKAAGSNVYGIHAGYLASAKAGEDGVFKFADQEERYEDSLERATTFVNEVNSSFVEKDITFLIENLFPTRTRKTSLFCTVTEIREFMKLVPETVGLLLDLGHLNVSSTILGFDRFAFLEEYLDIFGERVLEVHISENDGWKDEHLPLKDNSWQLDALLSVKSHPSKNGFERVYCLEARNATLEELSASLNSVSEILDS
jgi:sugar phosphate isomerase/epimerase